uniref:Retrovirus-related Pol polyprotein from transposon TNT 1-94 n=1 Tax=Lygus hesperus TaxID=30085 RepID=A0A146M1T4_LYGHE
MPYTPEQNGCCEQEHRTIVEASRTLMHAHGDLPKGLWAEIINTAAYIINRTGVSGIEGKSPYELWVGRKPSIKNLRIIGCTCYAHIPKQFRGKMSKKAVKGILIGYDENDGYRIWSLDKLKLIRSRDVIFDEEPLKQVEHLNSDKPEEPDESCVDFRRFLEKKDETNEHLDPNKNENPDTPSITEDEGGPSNENVSDDGGNVEDEIPDRVLRDRETLRPPERYGFDALVMSAETDVLNLEEPKNYREAINSENKVNWEKAMQSEIDSLHENKTWTLANLPDGKKAISTKWVYKVKMNPDGTIDKFKARLVVQGFSQRLGIDYEQTFSPVAKASTVRTLLSVAASKNMKLMQFDVSTAFLYGYLEEEIYIKQPEGFDDGSNKVCKLNRSLYGLKQAPRCWNQRFAAFLLKIGFKQSNADTCLFLKKTESTHIMIALYVDDGLVASIREEDLEIFIRDLKKEFKITTKPASYYLGFESHQQEGRITLNQKAYLKKLLERFGMENCRPSPTPMIQTGEEKDIEDPAKKEKFPYRQAVGGLMYLMVGTRPDIAYAVGVASRTLENPTWNNWVQVKRIFRYLKGTSQLGLLYKSGNNSLVCYSDADHGGDHSTGRSTTGVVAMFSNAAISWLSQRQTSVSISTTEAEIVAASDLWLKRLLLDMEN